MDITVVTQRIENLVIAAAVVVAFVHLDFAWWWLLALFLIFDLSALGYAVSPAVGALMYNAVHNYVAPAGLVIVAFAADAEWAAFLSLAWAFHIAIDRLLGFGLKFTDRFQHTHLGTIGK